MKYIASLVLFIILYSLFIIHDAHAQTMSNGSYILEQGNLNSFAGKATGSNNKVTFSSGTTAQGVYTGTNYKIRQGFQYTQSAAGSGSFTFTISSGSISFGTINPGEPITRNSTLLISSPDSGYQVIASEDHSMRNSNRVDIPDTKCDDGNCSETQSSLWTSPLTFGFGYRCDNTASSPCVSDFLTYDSYRQFANKEASESAQTIMSSDNPVTNNQSTITYKVNISGSQAPGTYQNSILYIASPSL
ncbi:MAG TPA: hypothetical protein VG965_03210 [Patescibacteria group bacterium]|nr:hypothetical protein [Patescibacteria group bacterium]